MDAAPASSLERILSRRSLIRGHARIAALWSIAAAILLLLLLLDLNLVLGLMIERGRVDLVLSPTEAAQFQQLTGLKVINPPAEGAKPAPESTEPIHVEFVERGILPAVWHTRGLWWGSAVSTLFRRVDWLQSNFLALSWLLLIGIVLFVMRDFCLKQLRSGAQWVATEGVTATRRNLHRQVLRLGPEDVDGSGQEMAIRLFTTEVDTIRNGLYESVYRMLRYPLELACIALILLTLDWKLALQWIAPLLLCLMVLDVVRRSALQKQRLAEDQGRAEEHTLLSNLKNARLIRGLGIEQGQHEQFQKHLERYHAKLLHSARATDQVFYPQSRIVLCCITLLAFLIYLVCDNLFSSHSTAGGIGLTAAEALTFLIAIPLAIPGIRELRRLPPIRRELKLSADRVHRYLDQIPSVSQAVGAKFLQPMSKTLHFENVKYQTAEGRKMLDGVDFKLEVDKTFAIVSVDPLEAKAVAMMLPRFIEPREGRVMIDGEDISWVTLESLRAETVFVAADDPPFEGTVVENIRGGQSDLTLQQVTDAAKMTHAHNFIVKLFNGYETVLTSEGDSLDAGQRFRLSLARAIVRDPALLVIEEPSETLDEDTKALLADAYDRICRNRTVIFLPARMSTIRRTDQIVVLHEGRVAAIGHHDKLKTQSSVYLHWQYLRFNEFRHES